MKFIGINDAFKSDKSNLTSLIATIGICVFCALTGIGVKTMIDMQSDSDIKAHESEVAELLEEAETSVTSESTIETSETSESLASASVFESTKETETTTVETSISETTAAETTAATSEVTETTAKRNAVNTDSTVSKTKKKDTGKKKAEPTKAPATATPSPKPKNSISETRVSLRVYAAGTVNLRSKPDKNSALVRTLEDGDAIDVVAKTSNGWYKTFNGNYVLASLTTENKPASETEAPSTSKAAATAKETTKATTKASETTKTTTAESSSAKPDKKGMTFLGKYTVTFYGPQKLKDGTYSYGTASGKTCTEGRTIAADPSIPFGTVIYVENDPLGGDGYYTVEDRGPGVTGNEIDIFAEDGESGNHNTTSRNVYIVNK